MSNNVRVNIISVTFCTLIFLCDMLLGMSGLTLLYSSIIFLSLIWGDGKSIVVSTLSAIILTLFGLFVRIEYFDLYSYDIMFRASTFFVLVISGLVSIKQKLVEDSLKSLNDELELRVLARTASSESRVRLLESQIRILKHMRGKDTSNSLNELDGVIDQLKILSEQEMEFTNV